MDPLTIESKTEKPGLSFTCVYDNYRVNPELKTEWGFAVVINMPSENILFDTGGDPDILLYNMKKIGIHPDSINKVVISHGHYDHIGGLPGFLDENRNVTVFLPPSVPNAVKKMITGKGAEFVEVSEVCKISDFIYSTGELSGYPNEQALVIDSKKGVIVITGCAHPGIVRIVEKAKEMMGVTDVYLVTGGFHHPPLSVVKKFVELGVKKVAPSHCSGDPVRKAFAEEYGQDFIAYGVGKIIEIK
ncbi:MAG: MBL fold metallo-hydrolase [Bacteroidales bacterium]|nr:MBL fold metallo-hydrolase [Bacteroidales bacterium]